MYNDIDELKGLVGTFAKAVPENKFSLAEIQGFLLGCKNDPNRANNLVVKWVEEERAKKENGKDVESDDLKTTEDSGLEEGNGRKLEVVD